MYQEIINALQNKKGTPEKQAILSSFFKCGKGEYGEGDLFLGISVPEQRRIAKEFLKRATFLDIEKLLSEKYHECRLTGFFILVYQFQKAKTAEEKKEIFDFYCSHLFAVNNWDLVDTTAPYIVGEYMIIKPKERYRLYDWANSANLWERRNCNSEYICIP